MKKILLFSLAVTAIMSCKKDVKSENQESVITADSEEKTAKQSDGLTLLKGDFIYFDNAAVLQTHADVYGVVIDDKMQELNKLVGQYKKEATDMVPVEIRGKILVKQNNEEGWPLRVEIKEILNISKPNPEDNNVVKIGQ